MNKAVFFDRDGTLIKDVPYLSNPELVQLESRVLPALRLLKDQGFKIIIVTNQSGIGRGLISEEAYHDVHARLIAILKERNLEVDDVFYCPYHSVHGKGDYKKESEDRKPSSGMLLKGIKRHSLSPEQCFMVGDKCSDVEAGQAASIKSILVRTGDGVSSVSSLGSLSPDYIAEDVYDAVVNYILRVS